jgi:hypothetical protein
MYTYEGAIGISYSSEYSSCMHMPYAEDAVALVRVPK